MKVTSEITINRPRERVVELITNSDYTPKWQPGVKSVELLSGEKDQLGARSRVIFEFSGMQLEVVETVIMRSPPDRFASAFEASRRHPARSRTVSTRPDPVKRAGLWFRRVPLQPGDVCFRRPDPRRGCETGCPVHAALQSFAESS
ncbi:MAG: SRPBCC family protein [Caldilineales bacterium]